MASIGNTAVKTSKGLRSKLGGNLSTQLNESQLFIDLADIHEICNSYLNSIEKILSIDKSDKEELANAFYEIDTELFEHLPYHTKSLKKLLPKVIDQLEK